MLVLFGLHLLMRLLGTQALDYRFLGPETTHPFVEDVHQIRDTLQVPALHLAIVQGDSVLLYDISGRDQPTDQFASSAQTLFPLASVTKTWAAALLLRLEAKGLLSLEDPVRKYLPKKKIPKEVLIKHVLSHSSQENPGERFEYSYRFGWLREIVEEVTKQDLPQVFEKEFLRPLALRNTLPGKESKLYKPYFKRIAPPYRLDSAKAKSTRGPGPKLSTSSGLISNLDDMIIYNRALDDGRLLADSLRDKMWAARLNFKGDTLPYGLGWFNARVAHKVVHWHYGQLGGYSTVLLKIPEMDLSLILLSNSGAVSDHAHMIQGKPLRSALLFSFFKHFVFPEAYRKNWDWSLSETSLAQAYDSLRVDSLGASLFREELVAEFMKQSYLARRNKHLLASARKLMNLIIRTHPHIEAWVAPQFLYGAEAFVEKETIEFLPLLEKIALNTWEADPGNPYTNYWLGRFYEKTKEEERALPYYEYLAQRKNDSPTWYTREPTYKTAKAYESKDPARARKYYQKLINWGSESGYLYYEALRGLKRIKLNQR